MPKFQFVAEQHDEIVKSSTHATEEEALAAQTAFFVDQYHDLWVESMQENSEAAEDDEERDPHDISKIPEDEIDSYVMDYFWNACRKEDGWSTWIEEIE